ncbi:MAG: hypothetical protein IPI64_03145 [Chloracidobacterium sp.]|nr:hypothetical protein [Chloracidobacterium sp.]
MKKRIFVIASAVLVFGLAIAAYALNNSNTSHAVAKAASCCCKGDSCPMKDKNATADTVAKHENCDCCGDSCPMKKGDATMAGMKMEGSESCPMMKGDAAQKTRGEMKMENGESCPMMNGKADHKMDAGMKHEMKADGKGHSCACCDHAKEKKDAPAV